MATASLQTLKRARELFPRNVAVTIRYAETLMQLGDAKKAHEILLDLFNTVPPTPEQAKLTAMAANAAGDVADSYFYMSEYHILSGDLLLAVSQLQLALAVPKISEVQRARFEARLDEIQQALPKRSAAPAYRSQQRRRAAADAQIDTILAPAGVRYPGPAAIDLPARRPTCISRLLEGFTTHVHVYCAPRPCCLPPWPSPAAPAPRPHHQRRKLRRLQSRRLQIQRHASIARR